MRKKKGSITIISIVLLLGTIALMIAQHYRNEPRSFSYADGQELSIFVERQGEVQNYFLLQQRDTLLTLSGSTDLLCDAPQLKLWDVDQDGKLDLYWEHCGGHGFVSGAKEELRYTAIADHDFTFKKGIYAWYFNPMLQWLTRGFSLMLLLLLLFIYWPKKQKYKP